MSSLNNGREQFANFLRGIEGNAFSSSAPQPSANYEAPKQVSVEHVVEDVSVTSTETE